MRPLTEAAETIGQVVDMINSIATNSIAGQTNLLALNATIEASAEVLKRAGYVVTVTLMPFARAMQQTSKGGVMIGVFKSAEREKLFNTPTGLSTTTSSYRAISPPTTSPCCRRRSPASPIISSSAVTCRTAMRR